MMPAVSYSAIHVLSYTRTCWDSQPRRSQLYAADRPSHVLDLSHFSSSRGSKQLFVAQSSQDSEDCQLLLLDSAPPADLVDLAETLQTQTEHVQRQSRTAARSLSNPHSGEQRLTQPHSVSPQSFTAVSKCGSCCFVSQCSRQKTKPQRRQ